MSKFLKYLILQYLPGDLGRYYHLRYKKLMLPRYFSDALNKTRDMVSIDLGANAGVYTVIMANVVRKVIAFEPDPLAIVMLKESVVGLDNILVEEAAAGIFEGQVYLYRHVQFSDDPVYRSESSTLIASKCNVSKKDALLVHQVDFPSYLRSLESEIGVIKMDIEGAEIDLLEALFAQSDLLEIINYIFVETHEDRIPGQEERLARLKESAQGLSKPKVNFLWN